jgi:hypothetical protein
MLTPLMVNRRFAREQTYVAFPNLRRGRQSGGCCSSYRFASRLNAG